MSQEIETWLSNAFQHAEKINGADHKFIHVYDTEKKAVVRLFSLDFTDESKNKHLSYKYMNLNDESKSSSLVFVLYSKVINRFKTKRYIYLSHDYDIIENIIKQIQKNELGILGLLSLLKNIT